MDTLIARVRKHLETGNIEWAKNAIFTAETVDDLDRLVDELVRLGLWESLHHDVKEAIKKRRGVLAAKAAAKTMAQSTTPKP